MIVVTPEWEKQASDWLAVMQIQPEGPVYVLAQALTNAYELGLKMGQRTPTPSDLESVGHAICQVFGQAWDDLGAYEKTQYLTAAKAAITEWGQCQSPATPTPRPTVEANGVKPCGCRYSSVYPTKPIRFCDTHRPPRKYKPRRK